ncbi:MAG: phosphatase PAP2 family protein [Ilumatobacteraceae bacterium]
MTDSSIVEPDSIRWKTSPIDKRGWQMMLATFVVGTLVYTLVGRAIVAWWDTGSAGRVDADVNRWLEDHRTARLTSFAEVVSNAGDTLSKVIAGVVLIPVFLWLFRRWHEYALIVGGLVVEVCTFGLSSELVGRDRPPVEQLDGAPTNSFPSGHIAAATVYYAGLALVFFLRTRRPGARVVGVMIAVVGIGLTTWARLYQGMHYPTDAFAGIVLGLVVLATMWRVIHHTLPGEESPEAHDGAVGHGAAPSVAA